MEINSKGYQCQRKDCIYKGDGAPCNDHASCNYFFLTGRLRIMQPGGADPAKCELYISKTEAGGKPKINRNTGAPIWDSTAMTMYRAMHRDSAIAAALGLSENTIRLWRHRRNLPSNGTRQLHELIDWDKARKLYDEGKFDKEIAAEFGCTEYYIAQWRRECGLISNARIKPRTQAKWDQQKARELYDAGMNDPEIAAAVGASKSAICNWRHRHKLPTNAEQGFRRKEQG